MDSVGVEIDVKINGIGDDLGDDDVFIWVEGDAKNEKTDKRLVGRSGTQPQEIHEEKKERVLSEEDKRLLGEWKYWGEDSTVGKGGKIGSSNGNTKAGKGSWVQKSRKRCRHPSWMGKSQGGGWQGGWQEDDWQGDRTNDDRLWQGAWQEDECHDC